VRFRPKMVWVHTQRIIALDVHAVPRFYRFFPELFINKLSSSDYAVLF
jgi:hypothetical protein